MLATMELKHMSLDRVVSLFRVERTSPYERFAKYLRLYVQTVSESEMTRDDQIDPSYQEFVEETESFARDIEALIVSIEELKHDYPQIKVWAVPLNRMALALKEYPAAVELGEVLPQFRARLQQVMQEVIITGESVAETLPTSERLMINTFLGNCRKTLGSLSN